MLTFLFWNLKRGRADILANVVKNHAVDVLLLAECPLLPATVLTALNRNTPEYFVVQSGCPRIAIYTRISEQHMEPLASGADYTIRHLVLPTRPTMLLCVVHFPSKLRQNPIDQTIYTVNFSDILADAENRVGHTRTILVGDLNMNPYDDGVVVTRGLHAVPTRAIARRETRTVKFESNLYFFNPMWQHFGEQPEGHAGTYYFSSPKTRADFWNTYDQVLLRPDLLPYFHDNDLEVLHHDLAGHGSLLSRGIPDQARVSDHLPILFRLRFTGRAQP